MYSRDRGIEGGRLVQGPVVTFNILSAEGGRLRNSGYIYNTENKRLEPKVMKVCGTSPFHFGVIFQVNQPSVVEGKACPTKCTHDANLVVNITGKRGQPQNPKV